MGKAASLGSPGTDYRAVGPRDTRAALSSAWRSSGVERAEHDHTLRIDADALAGIGLDKPGKLHERTASGIEDRTLDILGSPHNAVSVATDERYLRRGGQRRGRQHGSSMIRTIDARRWQFEAPRRGCGISAPVGTTRRLAPRVSIVSFGSHASAQLRFGGMRARS
jgi:hypothetical protein